MLTQMSEGAFEDSNRYFAQGFRERRAMVILRGFDADRTVELARRAWSSGIALVEVPLQDERSAQALTAAVAAAREEGRQVGAGTIVSVELAERAAHLGASFTVAPGCDLRVAARSVELGMPHLPGVGSATEVQAAMRAGLRWLKAFPATSLGVTWIEAMQGPFPTARFVATGGIDADNARDFLDRGTAGVSFGNSFADVTAAAIAALPS